MEEFKLPNKQITIKFIGRNVGMATNVDKNHVISGGMLINAIKKYSAPLQRNGSIANVLTTAEKVELERLTGLNLSIYDSFWESYRVILRKDSAANILDLSNPMDYIGYKILLAYREEIAASWAERNKKATYQFAITQDEEVEIEDNTKLNVKKEAFLAYVKLEDDKEQVLGLLRLLTNKPISQDSKLPWLQGQLQAIVDSNPAKFLSVIKDKSLDTKLLVENAVNKKVLIKKAHKYSTADGLELCRSGEIPTLDNVIRYLEDPLNSEIRAIIEAKTAKAK